MKRNISRYLFSICMIFILAVSAVSVIPVQAAATYTLTFRSGNVGSFDTAKVGAAVKNSSLVEVKKRVHQSESEERRQCCLCCI